MYQHPFAVARAKGIAVMHLDEMDVARVQNQALRAELQTLRGEQQRQTQTLDTEQETSASASEALRAEQQALRAEQTQTLDTEQETSPSEAMVLVAREGEGAVPVLDSKLLTLRHQALDAAAAAPEVRELLLKILNLPTAQQMVISGALNLHQPSQPSGPSGPTVTPTDGDPEQIAVTGGCEDYGGPPVKWTTAKEIPGTNSWYYVLRCQVCGVMAVTAAGTGDGPVTWAVQKGWSTPSNGNRRWRRCQCPLHPFR